MPGAIARETGEAALLPGVSDSVRRHPTELAHATATLDRPTAGATNPAPYPDPPSLRGPASPVGSL